MVIEALTERFVIVPEEIRAGVSYIGERDVLKKFHRYAIRCVDTDDFGSVLSNVLPDSESDKSVSGQES